MFHSISATLVLLGGIIRNTSILLSFYFYLFLIQKVIYSGFDDAMNFIGARIEVNILTLIDSFDVDTGILIRLLTHKFYGAFLYNFEFFL